MCYQKRAGCWQNWLLQLGFECVSPANVWWRPAVTSGFPCMINWVFNFEIWGETRRVGASTRRVGSWPGDVENEWTQRVIAGGRNPNFLGLGPI